MPDIIRRSRLRFPKLVAIVLFALALALFTQGDIAQADPSTLAAPDDSFIVNEDTVLDANFLSNDDVAGCHPLNIFVACGDLFINDLPDNGSVSLTNFNGGIFHDSTAGAFKYIPNTNFFGTDTFNYTYTVITASIPLPIVSKATATVTITVNGTPDPPVAKNDSYNVDEDDQIVSSVSVLINDSDIDGDVPSTAEQLSGTSNGTLNFGANGVFSYTPDPDFNGSDSFTYRAVDATNLRSNSATVSIVVAPLPDAPRPQPDSYETPFGRALVVNDILQGVLDNDLEVDAGDVLTASLETDVTDGTLFFNSNGTFTYTPNGRVVEVTDGFEYEVCDTTDQCVVVPVTIEVSATLQSNVPFFDGTYTVNTSTSEEDIPLTIPGCYVSECSLRDALNTANTDNRDDSRIEFAIIGGAGPVVIPIASELPAITEKLVIDGTTQPRTGNDPPEIPFIVLDGDQITETVPGLHITAGGTTVKGISLVRFDGDGILIETGNENIIVDNHIGVDATGEVASGNGGNGIHILNSSRNTVGGSFTFNGTCSGDCNLISGNTG
ncbi:MAG: Ig-like domain-containing protein, partial [Gammaproteobacteria bacterium]|nr:Ig-like domain-containing protein [Gammaproteobacteria bacterium]